MICLFCKGNIRWWQRRLFYPNGQVIHARLCLPIFIRTRTLQGINRLHDHQIVDLIPVKESELNA